MDALGGRPGVRSKRFAPAPAGDVDSANNRHLLEQLRSAEEPSRRAHYVCVIALVQPGAADSIFRGRCDGEILTAPRGDGGFGYDPLFLPLGEQRTFAEMPAEEKNAMSHRADALRKAARFLSGEAVV